MRIDITAVGDDAEIGLREHDDFKAFSILLRGDGTARAALARVGRVADDEHVFVDPAVLKRLAGDRARDPDWSASLEGMIAFAAKHGWVDDAGYVRAHVERAA